MSILIAACPAPLVGAIWGPNCAAVNPVGAPLKNACLCLAVSEVIFLSAASLLFAKFIPFWAFCICNLAKSNWPDCAAVIALSNLAVGF